MQMCSLTLIFSFAMFFQKHKKASQESRKKSHRRRISSPAPSSSESDTDVGKTEQISTEKEKASVLSDSSRPPKKRKFRSAAQVDAEKEEERKQSPRKKGAQHEDQWRPLGGLSASNILFFQGFDKFFLGFP